MSLLTKYIIAFFVSMVPLIELRGAVPIGTGLGLPWDMTLIVSITVSYTHMTLPTTHIV